MQPVRGPASWVALGVWLLTLALSPAGAVAVESTKAQPASPSSIRSYWASARMRRASATEVTSPASATYRMHGPVFVSR